MRNILKIFRKIWNKTVILKRTTFAQSKAAKTNTVPGLLCGPTSAENTVRKIYKGPERKHD